MNRDDLDPLLNEALQVACHLLEKNGDFFPFGVVLRSDGGRRHVQGWTGDEQPEPQRVIALLLRGFRKGVESGDYRATALVKDVRVRDAQDGVTKDAVCVTLEHIEGTCINCYLPYAKVGGGYSYGEVFADPGEPAVIRGGPRDAEDQ